MTAGTTSFAKAIHSPCEMTMRISNRRMRRTIIESLLPCCTGLSPQLRTRMVSRPAEDAMEHHVAANELRLNLELLDDPLVLRLGADGAEQRFHLLVGQVGEPGEQFCRWTSETAGI